MKALPMHNPGYNKPTYNLPPRYIEGARKAIIIRNIISDNDGRLLLKKGMTGVVIPFHDRHLYQIFGEFYNWISRGLLWESKGFAKARLDQTYDFFHHYEKDGKKIVGSWHTYISFFDFEYTD